MSLKIRKLLFPVLFVCVSALFAVGCAQQGATLTQPTLKQELSGNKTLVPSASVLTLAAENHCNGQAQVDYASLVLFCENKSPAAQLPITITNNYAIAGQQFSCQVYGYTDANNQIKVPLTVTLGGVDDTGMACTPGASAPVTAPPAASVAK